MRLVALVHESARDPTADFIALHTARAIGLDHICMPTA